MKRFLLILSLCWTLLLGVVSSNQFFEQRRDIYQMLHEKAEAFLDGGVLFRHWNSRHGGVYAPITPDTPPNPWLDTPRRDVPTPWGETLTMINPAYMTRQAGDIARQQGHYRLGLVSLNPINPANQPDDWEREGLETLADGASEYAGHGIVDGVEAYRLLKPLITVESCLACHARDGYRLGDIRGALAVTVPVRDAKAIVNKDLSNLLVANGLVWLVGLIGLLFMSRVYEQKESRRIQAEQAMAKAYEELELSAWKLSETQELAGVGRWELDIQAGALEWSNNIYDLLEFDPREQRPSLDAVLRLIHPDDRERFKLAHKPSQGKRGPSNDIYRLRMPDGRVKHIRESLRTECDVEGGPVRSVGIVHDITGLYEAEERYRLLFDNANDAIFIQDRDIFLDCNEKTLEIFGAKDKQAFLNKRMHEVSPSTQPDGRPSLRVALEHHRLALKGEPQRFEWQALRLDGSPVDLDVSLSRLDQGGAALLISIVRDISRTKAAELALRRSEAQLKDAQRVANIGSFTREIATGKSIWSDQFYRILGYESGEIVPGFDLFRQHIHPADVSIVEETYRRMTPENPSGQFTARFIGKDGRQGWLTLSVNYEFDEKGVPKRSFGAIQDVTDLKRYQNTIEWELKVNAALASCTQSILSNQYNMEQLSDLFLDAALKLSRSEYGFVAAVDPETRVITGHTLTRMLGRSCPLSEANAEGVFRPGPDGNFCNLFGLSVDTGEAFVTEEPSKHPLSRGLPAGHVPIRRFLSAPGLVGGHVRGLLALANSPEPYSDDMLQAMVRLAQLFALAMVRWEAQQALAKRDAMLLGFMNSIKESAFLMKPDGAVLFANETMARRLEAEVGSIMGANIAEFLSAEQTAKRLEAVAEAVRSGRELRFEDSAGGRYFENLVYPLVEDGNVVSLAILGMDITARKQAELELSKLRRSVENSPLSIVITDVNGTIEYVNPAFSEVTGYSQDEVVGQNPRVMKSGVHDEEFYQGLWATIVSGRVWRGEICNRKKNGELFWEQVAIAPVRNDKGDIVNYVGIKEDISDRKDLERIKEDVERIMRHDLKSPLNGIIGLPQLLSLEGPLNPAQAEIAKEIEESGNNMLRLIDMSLDIFKMETGGYDYQPQPVDVLAVVEQVLRQVRARLQGKGLEASLSIDGDMPEIGSAFRILGEERLLYSLLSNLISNAIEASPLNAVVSLELVSSRPRRLSIRNRGAVPEAIRGDFFGKYKTYGKKSGTGLGAYSARLMARTMGFDIEMRTSDELDETTISLTFPENESV